MLVAAKAQVGRHFRKDDPADRRDLSRVLAAPFATQILGDLGAEVIKIEKPGGGDETRAFGPPFLEGKDGEPGDTRTKRYRPTTMPIRHKPNVAGGYINKRYCYSIVFLQCLTVNLFQLAGLLNCKQ